MGRLIRWELCRECATMSGFKAARRKRNETHLFYCDLRINQIILHH